MPGSEISACSMRVCMQPWKEPEQAAGRLPEQLQREAAQDELRWQAVDQQLVQLAAHLVHALRALLLQDQRRNLLHGACMRHFIRPCRIRATG
jgi:hypothetical protein